MSPAYYNEWDKGAAEWLRELIKAGEIAPGDVDERSIVDVKASDLKGFCQVHMFAGIGVWSAALRLAGWPDDRPVWSGSCPCQGYSVAGKGGGTGDDRDLWPVFASLIRECGPPVVVGEQVEAAIGYGWFDRVRRDLEAEAYAVGGIVLGAHSAGANHIRQRLWWVANAVGAGQRGIRAGGGEGVVEGARRRLPVFDGAGESGGLGNTTKREDHRREPGDMGETAREGGRSNDAVDDSGADGGLADVQKERPQGQRSDRDTQGRQGPDDGSAGLRGGTGLDLWRDSRWHHCRDGKQRRVPAEPGLFPLADARESKGFRVAALRGAGNAICLGAAAAFVAAVMESAREEEEAAQ